MKGEVFNLLKGILSREICVGLCYFQFLYKV